MVLIDMAWRISPDVRVFTLDTGRLPPETYTLFEEVRERYGISVEFEYPDTGAVASLVNREGPNLMYRGVDMRSMLRRPEGRAPPPEARHPRRLDRRAPSRAGPREGTSPRSSSTAITAASSS